MRFILKILDLVFWLFLVVIVGLCALAKIGS
jgi:hypothetical protein